MNVILTITVKEDTRIMREVGGESINNVVLLHLYITIPYVCGSKHPHIEIPDRKRKREVKCVVSAKMPLINDERG